MLHFIKNKNVGKAFISKKGKYDIEIRKFDDLNISNVDLIKIDVEGYELNTLRGAEKTLKNSDPIIVMECKHTALFNYTRNEVFNYLYNLGFSIKSKPTKNDYIFTKDELK